MMRFAAAALVFVLASGIPFQSAQSHVLVGGDTHFTPYMEKIRRALVKMTLAHIDKDGAPVQVQQYGIIEKIRFNPPEEAEFLKDPSFGVFVPQGGGVPYEEVKFLYMANGRKGAWTFNAEFNMGDFRQLNLEYPEKRIFNEIIAFIIGIRKEECEAVAQMYGLEEVPRLRSDQSALYKKSMVTERGADYEVPYTEGPALDHPAFIGARSGCFLSYDGTEYVFFNNVMEN